MDHLPVIADIPEPISKTSKPNTKIKSKSKKRTRVAINNDNIGGKIPSTQKKKRKKKKKIVVLNGRCSDPQKKTAEGNRKKL